MTRDELLGVLRPFGEATPLPRAAFVDPGVLELEERAIFASLVDPGRARGGPGAARATGCGPAPRRAPDRRAPRGPGDRRALRRLLAPRTLLCDGERGHLEALHVRCPYHGWTYATDGSLLEAPGAAPGSKPPGLVRARVEARAGVVFVNLDPAARPRRELGRRPAVALAMQAFALERARRSDHEVRANWKVVVGNFQESHHFPSVHPSLEGRTPWAALFERHRERGLARRDHGAFARASRPCPRAAAGAAAPSWQPRRTAAA